MNALRDPAVFMARASSPVVVPVAEEPNPAARGSNLASVANPVDNPGDVRAAE